jgi:6-phosphogluconate dehydrogenase
MRKDGRYGGTARHALGFIGLGIMGGPMAMNCIRADFGMTVCKKTTAGQGGHNP